MKDVLIYTTRACAYCTVAKRALERRGIPYREIDITRTPEVRNELKARTGEWSVPQVFVDDAYIGQDDELVALVASGALDVADEEETPPEAGPEGKVWTAAVVGAGRWGLTAACALAASGSVLVLDRAPHVPGADPETDRLRAEAEAAGATLRKAEVYGLEAEDGAHGLVTLEDVVRARVVVVATGLGDRTPTLAGEAALLGKGVSHCAECDAPFFEGLPVAVVGADERTAAEALFLAERTAEVTLLCPDPAMAVRPITTAALRAAGVTLRTGTRVRTIAGDTHVSGLLVEDGAGRTSLEVAGVFVYLPGDRPGTRFLHGLADMGPSGALKVNPDGATSLSGLFALGPAATGGADDPDDPREAAARLAAAVGRASTAR